MSAYGLRGFQAARRRRSSAADSSTLISRFTRIDRDPIAVAQQPDGPAHGRLRGNMSDDEAVAAAGEAPVGDERDLVAQPAPHDGAGRD